MPVWIPTLTPGARGATDRYGVFFLLAPNQGLFTACWAATSALIAHARAWPARAGATVPGGPG